MKASSPSYRYDGNIGTVRRVSDSGSFDVVCERNADASSVDDSACDTPRPYPVMTTKHRKKKVYSLRSTKSYHPHIVTHHNYSDHANDSMYGVDVESTDSKSDSRRTSICKDVAPPFPVKLYEMLDRVDTEGYRHIISWQPHGRCFVVHDAGAFKPLLPNYFKLRKIASFQRQLNLYGFQRLTVGLDKGGYYNELFLRNRPDLVPLIHRVKVKGTGVRAKSNPKEEPNLYEYPAVDHVAVTSSSHRSDRPGNLLHQHGHTNDDVAFALNSRLAVSKGNSAVSPSCLEMEPQSHEIFSNAVACAALETEGVKGDVSFDLLIDEMYSHNQSLDFADLLKLASVK